MSEAEPGHGGSRPALARPYSWTEGRTQPAVEIAVEAQVRATVDWIPHPRTSPLWTVIGLCAEPCSVAEIAAHMAVPLGVAKVLVADLLRDGLVSVAATLGEDASVDERRELIERVLSGLRAR
ncbi:MAG TPA: DUF742 domain-containing protein [Actinophytocola sp.]|uniref:DUF742 domain-containing protein n=1 Tax=Actinophytocola sp. TaxID=1872138 RepID=UPI002DDCDA1F|nr:DUF742 domain-containing protein [Actinophytocola sp.]HEV2778357.1 DUF742 domain-containing protein [Actinophytocola sp.]